MTLLTTEMKQKLPGLYSQEKVPDPLALVKFYDTQTDWTWYGIELDAESNLLFGLVLGFERELGYFSIEELEQINDQAGFPRIRCDKGFRPTRVSKIQR